MSAIGGRMRADPHKALRAQLLALVGDGARVLQSTSRPWASATFAGQRHVLTLIVTGWDAILRAGTLPSELADHEFEIPGHFVADICVDDARAMVNARDESELLVEISALTVEEW